ncbi:hypothetical protein WR25_01080 [Diploscapter pachys]|uniref:Uncharacterized protein n=1 Tax=Diploscapter pachys TaxID=2018661 RepID=A0A2A2LP16_9BILA|nr:hypothetical protein WR25_01080 [Diploscapter pachys]
MFSHLVHDMIDKGSPLAYSTHGSEQLNYFFKNLQNPRVTNDFDEDSANRLLTWRTVFDNCETRSLDTPIPELRDFVEQISKSKRACLKLAEPFAEGIRIDRNDSLAVPHPNDSKYYLFDQIYQAAQQHYPGSNIEFFSRIGWRTQCLSSPDYWPEPAVSQVYLKYWVGANEELNHIEHVYRGAMEEGEQPNEVDRRKRSSRVLQPMNENDSNRGRPIKTQKMSRPMESPPSSSNLPLRFKADQSQKGCPMESPPSSSNLPLRFKADQAHYYNTPLYIPPSIPHGFHQLQGYYPPSNNVGPSQLPTVSTFSPSAFTKIQSRSLSSYTSPLQHTQYMDPSAMPQLQMAVKSQDMPGKFTPLMKQPQDWNEVEVISQPQDWNEVILEDVSNDRNEDYGSARRSDEVDETEDLAVADDNHRLYRETLQTLKEMRMTGGDFSTFKTLMERSVGWVRKEKSRTAYQVLLEDSPMETAPTEELHEMKAVNAYSLYVTATWIEEERKKKREKPTSKASTLIGKGNAQLTDTEIAALSQDPDRFDHPLAFLNKEIHDDLKVQDLFHIVLPSAQKRETMLIIQMLPPNTKERYTVSARYTSNSLTCLPNPLVMKLQASLRSLVTLKPTYLNAGLEVDSQTWDRTIFELIDTSLRNSENRKLMNSETTAFKKKKKKFSFTTLSDKEYQDLLMSDSYSMNDNWYEGITLTVQSD